MKPRILIVDEEEDVLAQIRPALEFDYEILTATKEEEARQIFADKKPAVVTLELSLNKENPGDVTGLRLLEQFLKRDPSTRIIVITASNEESSVRLLFQTNPPGRDETHRPTSLSHAAVAAKATGNVPTGKLLKYCPCA